MKVPFTLSSGRVKSVCALFSPAYRKTRIRDNLLPFPAPGREIEFNYFLRRHGAAEWRLL